MSNFTYFIMVGKRKYFLRKFSWLKPQHNQKYDPIGFVSDDGKVFGTLFENCKTMEEAVKLAEKNGHNIQKEKGKK